MARAILIDTTRREIEPLDLDPAAPELVKSLARALGCRCLALGARIPTGGTIYVDATAIHTSRQFFRHCLVGSPLAGSGIVLAERDIAADSIRPLIEFLDWPDVFPSHADAWWVQDAAADLLSGRPPTAKAFSLCRADNENRVMGMSR